MDASSNPADSTRWLARKAPSAEANEHDTSHVFDTTINPDASIIASIEETGESDVHSMASGRPIGTSWSAIPATNTDQQSSHDDEDPAAASMTYQSTGNSGPIPHSDARSASYTTNSNLTSFSRDSFEPGPPPTPYVGSYGVSVPSNTGVQPTSTSYASSAPSTYFPSLHASLPTEFGINREHRAWSHSEYPQNLVFQQPSVNQSQGNLQNQFGSPIMAPDVAQYDMRLSMMPLPYQESVYGQQAQQSVLTHHGSVVYDNSDYVSPPIRAPSSLPLQLASTYERMHQNVQPYQFGQTQAPEVNVEPSRSHQSPPRRGSAARPSSRRRKTSSPNARGSRDVRGFTTPTTKSVSNVRISEAMLTPVVASVSDLSEDERLLKVLKDDWNSRDQNARGTAPMWKHIQDQYNARRPSNPKEPAALQMMETRMRAKLRRWTEDEVKILLECQANTELPHKSKKSNPSWEPIAVKMHKEYGVTPKIPHENCRKKWIQVQELLGSDMPDHDAGIVDEEDDDEPMGDDDSAAAETGYTTGAESELDEATAPGRINSYPAGEMSAKGAPRELPSPSQDDQDVYRNMTW